MKKLITILVISASFSCFSQTADAKIDSMKVNFTNFHEQYMSGVTLTVVGSAVAGIGVFVGARNYNSIRANEQSKIDAIALMSIGSGIAIIGYIIQVDSHKFIARAGAGGVNLTYKF